MIVSIGDGEELFTFFEDNEFEVKVDRFFLLARELDIDTRALELEPPEACAEIMRGLISAGHASSVEDAKAYVIEFCSRVAFPKPKLVH